MKNNTELSFLYTIGYEGRTLDEFVAQLKEFDISILVDVREIPHSRKKGFSKIPLSRCLREYHIDYLHVQELGSPKRLRQKLRLDGDHNYFSDEYYKYIRSRTKIIKDLYASILGKVCCIMCYEKSFENCHRNIVADEIKKLDGNGIIVQHIMR